MGRVLLYPLLGFVGFAVIMTLTVITLTAIENVVRARAIRNARWEMFAEPTEAGHIRVGVELTARWFLHDKHVIRRDPETVEVGAEDFLELAIVKTRAHNRAHAYNTAGQ